METDDLFNDGEHIIYVNGAKDEEKTPLGKLMHDFNTSDPDEMYYSLLAEKTRYFKENKEGVEAMCKAMEEMRNEAVYQRDREKIAELLMDNRTPEWICDICHYPMELILDVQRELSVVPMQ